MSTITKRIKSNVLRRLATAPLSQWPQALVECLDMLSAFGVCDHSMLAEMLRRVPGAGPEVRDIPREGPEPPEKLSPHVRRVCAYMRTHYGEPISIASLANRVGRNTGYLATLFRRQTGMTIHRYLTGIRMERAARLLRRREKVEAVVLLVGYRSKKNFYRQFEATFGVTPGKYKANYSTVKG